MAISQSDQLFQLVKSLTKSEKRNFTLYSTRIQDADDLMYIQLFDIIDKEKVLSDDIIMSKLKLKDKVKYSNLKRHLYKQIMTSLRMLFIQKDTDTQIREYLDYAMILYGKGFYKQAIKILEKAKQMAGKSNNDILLLSILETEKDIESKHITRSGVDIVPALIRQSKDLVDSIQRTAQLSNMRILLHSYYIQYGHVRNAEDLTKFENEFAWIAQYELEVDKMSYLEKVYYFQALVWYHYTRMDFDLCLKAAIAWVENLAVSPDLIDQNCDLYMRGFHYILTCTYYNGDLQTFDYYLDLLEKYRTDHYTSFNTNSQIISFLYVHSGRLNRCLITKKYADGLKAIPSTLRRIQKYKGKLDAHRILVFYFKIAWIHLMAGDHANALKYLNLIFVMEVSGLREDIQGYAQLMFLMAHHDAGNEDIMEYLIHGAEKYFAKAVDKTKLQIMTIAFFKKLYKAPLPARKVIKTDFLKALDTLNEDIFERRSIIYLDIKIWLETRVSGLR